MKISARNQFKGKVTDVKLGNVMAEVTIEIAGGTTLVAAITRGSAESLGLKKGDDVTALIKATEILVGK